MAANTNDLTGLAVDSTPTFFNFIGAVDVKIVEPLESAAGKIALVLVDGENFVNTGLLDSGLLSTSGNEALYVVDNDQDV